jgi:hypothetical protein
MQNRTRLGYLLVFLGGIVLVAACSSGSSREPVSLAEYFQRVQALHEEQELRSEVLTQDLDSQFGDIESIEEALEVMVEILPTFLPGFRTLLQDTRSGLDEMEPPVLVRDVRL